MWGKFTVDSPLEGDGFEPSVPRDRDDGFCSNSPSPILSPKETHGQSPLAGAEARPGLGSNNNRRGEMKIQSRPQRGLQTRDRTLSRRGALCSSGPAYPLQISGPLAFQKRQPFRNRLTQSSAPGVEFGLDDRLAEAKGAALRQRSRAMIRP